MEDNLIELFMNIFEISLACDSIGGGCNYLQ